MSSTTIVPPIQAAAAGRAHGAALHHVTAKKPGERTSPRRDPIVKPAVASGKLRVVPAVYEIKTGKVSFL